MLVLNQEDVNYPFDAEGSKMGSRRDWVQELESTVNPWEGSTIFVEQLPGPPVSDLVKLYTSTPESPISISSGSSSSPSTSPLPRPRGVPRYTSSLPRTAYTPPRGLTPRDDTQVNAQFGIQGRTQAGPRGGTSSKPIHPFFTRDFRRTNSVPAPAPPPSHRPRLVAHYSSTSASGSTTTTTTTGESQDRWRVGPHEVELVEERNRVENRETVSSSSEEEETVEERLDLEDISTMMSDLDLQSKTPRLPLVDRAHVPWDQSRRVQLTKSAKPPIRPGKPASTQRSKKQPVKTTSDLPLFHYRDVTPVPKIVYTSDPHEANDLITCLQGPLIGFDLEWPIAGQTNENGTVLGRKWDTEAKKYSFDQPKTALVQMCDETMVVLVQIWDMEKLPNKIIEVVQDPTMLKMGVNIRGDGHKLLRDFPNSFPKGLNSLVELSSVARRADPIIVGPGSTLIALARLVRTYLGKELDKDERVRKSVWTNKLDQEQIDYAANDVVVSLQLYKTLMRLARDNGINLDPTDFCASLGTDLAKGSGKTGFKGGSVGPVRPRQSEMRTLKLFKEGMTTARIAKQGNIQLATVQAYICTALDALPDDILTTEEKDRFIKEIPRESSLWTYHCETLRGLVVQPRTVKENLVDDGDFSS